MITESFDNKTKAKISLEDFYGERGNILDKMIITYSRQIYEYLLDTYPCEVIGNIKAVNGKMPIYKFPLGHEQIGFYLSPLGSAMASQTMAEACYITGATKVVSFGSAGSLDEKTKIEIVIPTEAYRDEGMSYHFKEASDYIAIKNCSKVKDILDEAKIPSISGRVWTTDAMLRETEGLIKKRFEDGCLCVEMELAGMQAVADFYNIELYYFLQTGDILYEEIYSKTDLHVANHSLEELYIALQIIKRI